MNLQGKAKELWDVKAENFPRTQAMSTQCVRAYEGRPGWEDEEDHIYTTNFTNIICSEVARLTFLGTKVTVEGARGKYLQDIVDRNYDKFRQWAEYANAAGTIIIKPNGTDFDIVDIDNVLVTETYNGKIWGAIFISSQKSTDGKVFYTRLEYHRFEGDGDNKVYKVSNKCFVGPTKYSVDEVIPIEDTPWASLTEEVTMENIERPLYAVLKTPQANPYEKDAPVGAPLVASTLRELQDLDTAYSRMTYEIWQSKRTVLLDADRLMTDGGDIRNKNTKIGAYDRTRANMGLPDFVKAIEGTGEGNIYNEINPTLTTPIRIDGLNIILSQIGYKIGFANGYFVFNQQMGIQTATGVEANQQRTIQFIKDCRDQLEACINDLLYAQAKFADLYDLAPAGDYKLVLDFGDITYNREEDKAMWWQYVSVGKVPFWYYMVKFEGMSEKDAKELEQMAQQQGLEQMMAQQQLLAAE